MNIKDKVVELTKKAWEMMKANRLMTAVIGFSVICFCGDIFCTFQRVLCILYG